jgi:hypothetical protein
VIVADLNQDGFPDIVTANRGTNTVSLRPGRGDGTFALGSDFGAGIDPFDLRAADFDGDGDLDLIVCNAGSASLSLLDNLTVNSTVSVEDGSPLQPEPTHLTLASPFPNPARDVIRAEVIWAASGPASLELFDVTGRSCFRQDMQSNRGRAQTVVLSTKTLASGVYLLRVSSGGEVVSRRIAFMKR